LERRAASAEELRYLRALLAYQFGRSAAELLAGGVEVRLSPQTGRIREVFVDGELVGTIRANDGFFVPSIAGARRLLLLLPYPRMRVVIPPDAAEFVAKGRSVFCKHILDADPELRPGEEVFVVDESGELLALGKAVMSGEEMLFKKAGVAVRVRKGVRERGKEIDRDKNNSICRTQRI